MKDLRNARILESYRAFLEQARVHERDGQTELAWACLVSAHILGQRSTWLHIRSHGAMFGLAWRTKDYRELIGQVSRLLGATAATWIWVPEGNTGRANVSAFKKMPIPPELQRLLVE